MDDIHDTFSRDITVVKEIKTPIDNLSDENDDYDFINDKNKGDEEFSYTSTMTTIKARVKYLDKEQTELLLASEKINVVSKFGLIRVKVKLADSETIADSSRITVDDNNCQMVFRDTNHGLFDNKYSTFYLERVA